MADQKTMPPKLKKGLIYGGIAAAGIGLVYVTTLTSETAPSVREPERVSLTGNADTRAVSLEGLNRRMADLETGGRRDATTLRNEVERLQSVVGNLTNQISLMQRDTDTAIDRRLSAAIEGLDLTQVGTGTSATPGPATEGPIAPRESRRTLPTPAPAPAPVDTAAEERRRAREQAELDRREAMYRPAEAPPMVASGQPAATAPRIAVYGSPDPEPNDESQELRSSIPDVQIPAGSIISAYLLTGLDAPTGTRAAQQPVPVLMRIKKEAILPNYAWANVADCHLLGSAYGDLGSERVNIRGEVVSCILADNSAVEGSVKFFVVGEDGKNGIRGTLVSRSGRILGAATGTALAQGLMSSLDSRSDSSVFLGGGGGGGGGALEGASKGFDLLTEYYLDLAEQTFPVLEVTNDRWVDVVVTEMLTIKFKG